MHCLKLSLLFPKSIFYSYKAFHGKTQLENVGPVATILQSQAVVWFQGPHMIKLLNELLTNDVCLYGGRQGRFLYGRPRPDTKLNRVGSGPGPDPDEPLEVFADVDASVLDELLSTLKKYHLRAKVDIENVTKELHCWQRYWGKKSSLRRPPL
ncbi:hypothetical protein M0R45_030456 [Rubus argutus]|uniref:Uncharacterized protein n=1 Tax=Rubus argutus TaxID=59490 RepID=A0AAW1WDA6_RUBAR